MTNKDKVLGMLGLSAKAGEIYFGADAVEDLVKKKKLKLIIIAQDASDRTKRNFKFICEQNNIPICFFGDIEVLSKSIGKENKAVIGIKNINFANKVEELINGGEIIG